MVGNFEEGEIVEVLQCVNLAGVMRVQSEYGWASLERFGTIQLERVRGEDELLKARADLERQQLSASSAERRGVHSVAVVQLQVDHHAEMEAAAARHEKVVESANAEWEAKLAAAEDKLKGKLASRRAKAEALHAQLAMELVDAQEVKNNHSLFTLI